jgi:hypothetical protein
LPGAITKELGDGVGEPPWRLLPLPVLLAWASAAVCRS